jgi:O-antigen/teichoic acid export membrane protein
LEKSYSDLIQLSARGSLILVIGKMGATLISAVGTIVIARVLGSTYFGVLAIAQIPVSITLLLLNNGVSNAIINYVAENRHKEETHNLRNIMFAGFLINVLVGLLASISLYLLAGFLANKVFQLAELGHLIRILSVSVLAQALLSTSNAVFIGYEKMGVSSIVSMLYSLLKSVIGPVLVFLGYGVVGAALGYSLPYLTTGVVAVLIVALFYGGVSSSSSASLYECVLMISWFNS